MDRCNTCEACRDDTESRRNPLPEKAGRSLFAFAAGFFGFRTAAVCLNCLSCQMVCPRGLAPNFLYAACQSGEEALLDSLGLSACTGCGACDERCPGRLPLRETFHEAGARLGRGTAVAAPAVRADPDRPRPPAGPVS